MIKSQRQENLDNLVLELDYIHQRLNLIENNVMSLKDASNTLAVTVSALIKMLINKNVITDEELDKMSVKVNKDLKKKLKKEIEKLKKSDKQAFYDLILNTDFCGHA